MLCKRNKPTTLSTASNDTFCSWIYNSSHNKLNEWKKKPDIAPFFEKQEEVKYNCIGVISCMHAYYFADS